MEFHIKVCENFLKLNKEVYESTKLCLKYKESIMMLEEQAKKIRLIKEKYALDEKHYKNRGVNLDMHEVVRNKDEELHHIFTDIQYFKSKISSLSYDESVYESYIRCENDLHHYKLNS